MNVFDLPEKLQVLYDKLTDRYGECKFDTSASRNIRTWTWTIKGVEHSLIMDWFGYWYITFPNINIQTRFNNEFGNVMATITDSNIEKFLIYIRILEV